MTDATTAPEWSRRRVVAALAAAGVAAPFVRGSRAYPSDAALLRYTAHVPNTHGLYARVFLPWEEICTEETDGRIRWEHYVDALLHGPLDGFKAIHSGITDYTHGYATYQPGSFHLTHGLQLPFLFDNAAIASLVSEELYPRYWKSEYERMGVYLAHCDATTAYDIMARTPVRRPSDLAGMKIRSTGGLMAEMIRAIGAIPVVLAAAETYTAFQRGIIDAVALSTPDMAAYRLWEIGRYCFRIGISHTVLQWCVRPGAFDALPEDLRVKLHDLFRLRGQVANRNYYGGAALQTAIDRLTENGVEVSAPTAEERQEWFETVRSVEQRFIDENEALGLPAGDFVAEARERAARYAGWSDDQLWEHVRANPVQGIITL